MLKINVGKRGKKWIFFFFFFFFFLEASERTKSKGYQS